MPRHLHHVLSRLSQAGRIAGGGGLWRRGAWVQLALLHLRGPGRRAAVPLGSQGHLQRQLLLQKATGASRGGEQPRRVHPPWSARWDQCNCQRKKGQLEQNWRLVVVVGCGVVWCGVAWRGVVCVGVCARELIGSLVVLTVVLALVLVILGSVAWIAHGPGQ